MKLGDRALLLLESWVARPERRDVLGDRFELRERIGEGGMGVVYAAYDRSSERLVAVKVIQGDSDQDVARFEREARSLAQVVHPAIVGYVTHGVHEGTPYLVMERLEGCSLAERLRQGRLPIRDAVVLGRRIASALAELHRAGIVHRDLKPSNVFLCDEDMARSCLLDFGLARSIDSTTLTANGALLGTPSYMAPERLRPGDPSVLPEGDIFSFGCVLYECLVGSPAFRAETTYAVLARIIVETAARVRAGRVETPPELERLVERMLAKEPSERPSAFEVVEALERLETSGLVGEATGGELAPNISEGTIIASKYRVIGKLGEGGMGVVLSAIHVDLGTQVAIKVLRAGEDSRLLREAQAASRLESQHVARVLDVGRTDDGRPFIVMEQLRGEDMARRLARTGRLPIDVATDHVRAICTILKEAHALGIVHRDLKPSNIFLESRRDGSEVVKVLDFGISKFTRRLDEDAITHTETAAAVVMGSVAYSAPEQLQSSASADARSDVWSLGVVLFELVTGARPFTGDNALAIAMSIASSEPRSLRALLPEAPLALERVIAKCLARAPTARFQNVDELAHALAEIRSTTSGLRRRKVLIAMAVPLVTGATALCLSSISKTPSVPSEAPEARAAETPPESRPASAPAPAPTPIDSATQAPSAAPPASTLRAALPRASTIPTPRTSTPMTAVSAPAASASPKRLNVRDPALDER